MTKKNQIIVTRPAETAIVVVVDDAQIDPVTEYLAGFGDASGRTMLNGLRSSLALMMGVDPKGKKRPSLAAVRAYPWHTIDSPRFVRIRQMLKDRYAVATANLFLTAVRGVLRKCRRQRLLDADTLADIDDEKGVKGVGREAGRYLETDVRASLHDACSETDAGRRDNVLLTTLYNTGARRDELSQLDVSDWDRGTHTLVLHGKGNKVREVPVSPELERVLAPFCAGRTGPMFYRTTVKGDARPGTRLGGAGIFAAITRLSKRADAGHVAPHDFRRTFVSDLLDVGVDAKTISKMVGHANVNTTMRYDRRDIRAAHEAVTKLKNARGTPK